MKIIYTTLTDEELSDIQPILHRTNRDIKNITHSLLLAAIRCSKNNSSMIDLDHLGIVRNKIKP
jgi:hypothetical protein